MMLIADVTEWLRKERFGEPTGQLKSCHGLPIGIDAGAVLADPPLAFQTRSAKGEGRAPQKHYSCMTFEELVPVASITAKDCFLFLWIPLRSVFLVEPLMKAWGFAFSGSAFTWAKTTKNAVVTPLSVTAAPGAESPWQMSGGYGTRHNAEVCWLGRRGAPRRKSKAVRELIVAPLREHSRKPDEAYGRIEALCDGPYVEMFARQQWPGPGWTCIGDEVEKFQVRHEHTCQ
jgi:N6-adenosine-specific RNA methylase IME4